MISERTSNCSQTTHSRSRDGTAFWIGTKKGKVYSFNPEEGSVSLRRQITAASSNKKKRRGCCPAGARVRIEQLEEIEGEDLVSVRARVGGFSKSLKKL